MECCSKGLLGSTNTSPYIGNQPLLISSVHNTGEGAAVEFCRPTSGIDLILYLYDIVYFNERKKPY